MKKLLVSSVSAVALLALAACGSEQEQASETPAETPVEQSGQAAEETVTETEQAAEEAGSNAIEQSAGEAVEAVQDAAENATNAAQEALGNAAETAGSVAGTAAETAQNAASAVTEGAQNAVDAASEALGNAANATTDTAGNATDIVGNALNEATQGAENALNELREGTENALAAITGSSALDATQWGSPDSDTAFVAFNGGTISGNGGCNTFTGSYEVSEDGSISVGPLATTKMACPEDVMTAETAFLASLQSATGYTIETDTLVLTDAGGNQVATMNRQAAN